MGAATKDAPTGARAAIDAEHAKMNGGAEGDPAADDTRSRATEHPDAQRPAPDPIEELGLAIEGQGQLSLEVGGKRPTAGSLTLVGGKVQIPSGQFLKGERIVVRVEATVRGVKHQDQVDSKTRQIVGCERQHFAQIESLTLVNAVEEAAGKEPAPPAEVDRTQALARVLGVLNDQSMTADEFVADALIDAVISK